MVSDNAHILHRQFAERVGVNCGITKVKVPLIFKDNMGLEEQQKSMQS